MLLTYEDCVAADHNDPLAPFRDAFSIPPQTIYFDGNSLGPLPKKALERSRQVIEEEWGIDLIRSWNKASWFELPTRLGNKLATVVGANADEIVITDTTSLNVFKAMAAALRIQQLAHPERKIIVSERENFPSDLYMIEGLVDLLQQGYTLRLIDEALPLEKALDHSVAVVALSHVNYRSGTMYDMAAISALAQAHGILTVWDLAHSAGAVPVALNASGADFAVGCTYKYLNGGPGAPAFIWVSKQYQNKSCQPLAGWWGHAKPFAMSAHYAAAPGIRKFLCGTQPILSMSVLECGLDIHAKTDMQAVRKKSLALSDLLIRLVESRCSHHGLKLLTPRDHRLRGSHVSFLHPQGYALIQALIARGVIGDYREPEVLRFGITPLYLGYTDVWNAVEILLDILNSGSWDRPEYKMKGAVT